jgi:hypothetical protein
VNCAGNSTVHAARDIEIFLSSIGCLRTSKTFAGNSANSSKNNIHLCASDISHGFNCVHHQTIATGLAV